MTTFQIPADVAYAYQLSAPFNQNLSVSLIDYIVPYINFQSSLAYLKTPPSTYLMPAVDILGGLQEIRQNASVEHMPPSILLMQRLPILSFRRTMVTSRTFPHCSPHSSIKTACRSYLFQVTV
jgi:hypothetical protein